VALYLTRREVFSRLAKNQARCSNKFSTTHIRHIRGPRRSILHRSHVSVSVTDCAYRRSRKKNTVTDRTATQNPFTIITMRSLSLQARSNKCGGHNSEPRVATHGAFLVGPGSPRAPVGMPPSANAGSRARLGPPHSLPIRRPPSVSRRLLQSPKHQRLSKSGLHSIMRHQKSKIRNPDQAGGRSPDLSMCGCACPGPGCTRFIVGDDRIAR